VRRTRIKICGVTTIEAADAAADAGADAVGFVFVKRSPRAIEPGRAWSLMADLPPFLSTVGLFVNASESEYARVESLCPTDFGQLHGVEQEQVVRACGPRVIKGVRFQEQTIASELRRWSAVPEVDAILVDGSAGGEGVAFDWPALAGAFEESAKPIILAGGLTPENVGEAIRTVRPFAVDVSSGVESAPGRKEASLIGAFCNAVRQADADAPS